MGTGTKVHATVEGTVKLNGTVVEACAKSTVEGVVGTVGSSTTTVTIPLSKITLEECGNDTVTVLKPGTLELHATGEGKATVTTSGIEITVLTHNILGTVHCIYKTKGSDLGTFKGRSATKATATWELGTLPLEKSSTDVGCSFEGLNLTGSYQVASPDYLEIDAVPSSSLTSPAGTEVESGAVIDAANEASIALDGTVNVTCSKATVEAKVKENKETSIATGPITSLTFEECGKNTVAVLGLGSLEIHAAGNGDGTITSTGTEITVLTHNILGTVHCIYATENTDVGALVGSRTTGGTATWSIESVPIPRKTTDFGCGSTSELTGNYKVASPDYLTVDPGAESEVQEPGAPLASPAGTTLGVGAKIHAVSAGNLVWDGTNFSVTCKYSTFEAKVSGSGEASIESLVFLECGNNTVAVLKAGKLVISSNTEGASGNGTVRSSGTEITLLTHNVVGTVHCIYYTEVTDLGTLKGSKTSGGTATWELGTRLLPQKATDPGCGEFSVTGEYTITTPDYLDVD